MDDVLVLLTLLALPVDAGDFAEPGGAAAPFDPVAARGEHLMPGEPRALSKKEEWLRDKALRPDFHTSDADLERTQKAQRRLARAPKRAAAPDTDVITRAGERIEPVTTLYNVWTREALPLLPGQSVEDRFHRFLRDHYTNQATRMDTRLVGVLTRVAGKFSAKRIEVVSGYRSPKYNLMLRKKGHQVARDSQHTHGNAVDFRIRGVGTRQVLHYVRSLRVGGVGFYPHSQFVHSDTGKVRYWTGS
jgi:Bacterial protein of unknown function (DUF882)